MQIGVPAAFLISVMRRRFARTRIVELLLRLRGTTRAASVTGALQAAFEDPQLEIQDWAPGTEPLSAGPGRRGAHRQRGGPPAAAHHLLLGEPAGRRAG